MPLKPASTPPLVPLLETVLAGENMQSKRRRSTLTRVRNYYRIFRLHSGPVKSLYFALSLAI